jgi:lipoprotein-anchoring transpeptidase ErfK/SrfK
MTLKRIISVAATAAFLVLPAQAVAASVAEVKQDHISVYRAPGDVASAKIRTIFRYESINGQPTRLPVVASKKVADKIWLRVRLSARPNGSTGWLDADGVTTSKPSYRISVDLSQRFLRVFYKGKKIRTSRVVIGAPATPTPPGYYFVVDSMRLDVGWAVHGWALATSAFSDVLRHFDGGEGQIAIHTTGRLSGRLGSASSHGCIRVPPRFAKWLARHIPNGTSIVIVR